VSKVISQGEGKAEAGKSEEEDQARRYNGAEIVTGSTRARYEELVLLKLFLFLPYLLTLKLDLIINFHK
jgi:hypothetical protein